jgi:hypothetical protein
MIKNATKHIIMKIKNTRPLRGRENGERGHNAASSSGDPLTRTTETYLIFGKLSSRAIPCGI